MVFDEYNEDSVRCMNHRIIAEDAECLQAISELRSIESFLNEFGFLSCGRDFTFCGGYSISLQMVLTSCELTAGSIVSCCEDGCMADAYSLLRKYRDDLFFYLYLAIFDANNKLDDVSSAIDKMGSNIERWVNNTLCDLPIGTVLKEIGQAPQVKEAVQKYDLKSYFCTIGDRLNNYVHSNGVLFYNRNVNAYQGNCLPVQMRGLLKDMRFITTAFLFLLTLCSPLSIMSTDYMDFLECNMTPPEGSQYWVAPFVTDFFKDNLDQIDKSCMQYLQDNTLMEFD